MGYTTDFTGEFSLDKPLTTEHAAYLKAFSSTRRVARDVAATEKRPDPLRVAVNLPVGEQGGYFVGADGFAGQERHESILDSNRPPSGQPGLWCQWTPSDDGTAIVWDEGEKFYDYVKWLSYLIDNFLKPWGYVLNGEVEWEGEESDDMGKIVVKNNAVSTKKGVVRYE
jgi:hypothetical protein